MKTLLIFPNQLFEQHPGFDAQPDRVFLMEDSLYFGDPHHPTQFHQQRIWLLRAAMQRYQALLEKRGFSLQYLEHDPSNPKAMHTERFASHFDSGHELLVAEPSDFLVEKRLRRLVKRLGCQLTILPTPGFINTRQENSRYRASKQRWFMADFYKWQRKRLDILMDGDVPEGGKWSFDDQNRKKIPARLLGSAPPLPSLRRDKYDREARVHVQRNYGNHPGELQNLYYPTSHAAARRWLNDFLEHRFGRFGDYEDAMEEGESWLWHSVLTPVLNIGLLTPREVVDTTLSFVETHEIPLNSVEGFLRQIIGWREFMRATYEDLGVAMRTTNHWRHTREIPSTFYDGTTGIAPVDDTIRRLLDTGYCHHIERLMVLGGFMFLCEFDPNEIYRWFMEMFVDSYDWVMVPNVYAMSQNADGGLITTKPYFSGSSYVRKMSHYRKAAWCEIWDGLYWRWIHLHSTELRKNPRWAMMCATASKMHDQKLASHLKNANEFLAQLDD